MSASHDDDRSVSPPPGGDADAPAPERAGRAHRRPTTWIVISALLAVAAVGLGIWAFSAQSDADDTQAKLEAATAAAAANQGEAPESEPAPTATAQPAPTAQPAELDPAAQQQIDEVTTALGATGETLEEIESDLDAAAANAQEAEQAKNEASNALERAQADVAAFKAEAETTGACLRGVLEAARSAFSAGGAQAAVEQLRALSGTCRSAGG